MTKEKVLARLTPAVLLKPYSAVGPVLLKSSCILQKGLPVQWRFNVPSSEYVALSTICDFNISFQLSRITRISPLLCPSWDQMMILLHCGGRQLHIFSCSGTAGSV